MDLYLPITAGSSTYGCVDTAMENDEEVELLSIVSVTNIWGDAAWSWYQSPKKKKLVCGLHKGINKYINRHCKKHAKTDRLREHIVHNFVSKRVRCSFLFLGAAPTMKLSASSAMYNQTTMPGHFAD
ncbi:hypothetical protein BDR06DRAFT_975562 [Suillus hirtellus]|nr:hypothetical protein BDR06DRAFT_975562 [Suillus hirtellus]